MNQTKKKKIEKGFLIGIGVTFLTLYVLGALFVWLFFTGGPAKVTKDISRYKEIFGWSTVSGMLVFPEEVSEEVIDTDFYYSFRDTLNTPTYQIYLQCTYEPKAYEEEIARLENVHKIYGGTEKKLLRDENQKYQYPAYIAIENHHDLYEYALVTGENQITYIATAYIDEDDVVFDKDYLPNDYMTEEGYSFTSGYCLYITLMSEEGIDYDNTRNEIAEVRYCHMEQIQDSFFIVRTLLDENNKEIIEEVGFDYYTSMDYEEGDYTVYTDLNGMEYRSLTLNEERTKAIVGYYDGSEEKEFVVELPFPEEK